MDINSEMGMIYLVISSCNTLQFKIVDSILVAPIKNQYQLQEGPLFFQETTNFDGQETTYKGWFTHITSQLAHKTDSVLSAATPKVVER